MDRRTAARVVPTAVPTGSTCSSNSAVVFTPVVPVDHAADDRESGAASTVERAASGQPELQAAAPCSPAHVAADNHGRTELSLAPAQPKESSVTIREIEVPVQRLELQPRLPKAQMSPAPHLKSGTPAGTSFLIAPSSRGF
jgi:hypothetical protein